MESNIEEFNRQLKEDIEKLKKETPKLKQDLELKMEEYGSIELMANLAIQELHAQGPLTHSPDNPLGENPIFVFLLGLFLIKNNLSAGEQMPDKVAEIVESAKKYFDNFKWIMAPMDPDNRQCTDDLIFLSRLKKLFDDLNPHCYPKQKEDHIRKVFSQIDYFLEQNYGFNTNDAIEFQQKIINRIEKLLQKKHDYTRQLVRNVQDQIDGNQNNDLIRQLESDGWDTENLLTLYGVTHFLSGSKDILMINVDDFSKEENVDSIKLRKYLMSMSCRFGQQIPNFNDPLSDNLIFYKPVIQIGESTFFCPKPDFLLYRLDSILEFLIEENSKTWQKYNKAKSDYLEDKAYEFFARVFSEQNLYRNLYFRFNQQRFECDLLLLYDNKIFIIESKSSHLPLSAKRGGMDSLRDSLKAIVRKAYRQGTNVRDYIKSAPNVNFEDENGNVVLIINYKPDNEFFFVNVTFENLGMIATNLKKLDALGLFTENEYPWSVNIYDLDIVTDLITEPAYFIHYLEQRIRAQNQDIFESAEEIDFLGYYFKIGNFYAELVSANRLDVIMIAPEYFGVLDECYLFDKPKPKLSIPKQLDELIKNMQKYKQRGFTKITSLLLDFTQKEREIIAKALEKRFVNTLKTGKVNGFSSMLPAPYDIGFSYFTSASMTKKFYQFTKIQYRRRKYQRKITRWAVIGRNTSDKKNFASFFLYDDKPWEFDQELENDVLRTFGRE